MAYKVLACLALLAVSSGKRDQTRWSRQISSYTADISDWVPLTGPIDRETPLQSKRQTVAEPRILSDPISELAGPPEFNSDTFSSRGFYNSPGNRQLYLQSMPAVPSAPQNYLNDQGFNQGFRFGLSPPNFPLTQSFLAPQYNFDTVPHLRPKPQIPTNPIRFDNFPPPIQPHIPPVKPILNSTPKPKYDVPKYVDGYRVENNTDSRLSQRLLHPTQKIKFEDYDKSKEVFALPKTKSEREEVQLLYVPVESLNRGQFNFRSPLTSAQFLNTDVYNQQQKPAPVRQNFGSEFQRPITKPFTPESLQSPEYLSNFNSQINGFSANKFTTLSSPFPTSVATTPRPTAKKLKPHQPPLAIFLTQNVKKDSNIKVGDVLSSLKAAKTVAVLDAVNPLNAPEVFIGPSSLTTPEHYVKFELPYLSNIENKDKKLKQLPFFVAPLSYNTPQGFAKIPFPSPHVGSVVINSQIQEASQSFKSTITPDLYQNSYQDPSLYRERQTGTQKPKISYYSTTAPKENILNNYEQNYYSFEPQTVSTMRPLKEKYNNPITQPPKTASYFLSNIENQYNPPQFSSFQQVPNYENPGSVKTLNTLKAETTSTLKTTTVTTKPTTTYQSQLLQTHNPFSINQAFHFSTPNDYQNNFDEYKESHATQKFNPSPPSSTATASYSSQETIKYEEPLKSTNHNQQATPGYSQNYSPEIHYQTEIQGLKYPAYNTNKYSTKEQSQEVDYSQSFRPSVANDNIKTVELKSPTESNTPILENYTYTASDVPKIQSNDIQTIKSQEEYQYDSYGSEETQTSSTTTTTTTRKTPTRTRGRPRYPANKPESTEYSTRAVITRKPARERRPLPSRNRYEPSRTTAEKTTKKASIESTTRSYKPRTRGKLQFRPTDGEESYDKHTKPSSKENDLAYQRDILHQNYPVTLMERASTVDIEAITEPTAKLDSSENTYSTTVDDTENADSNDKLSITEHINSQIKDVSQYTSAVESDTDIYVRKVPSRGSNEYSHESRTSLPSQDKKYSHEEVKDDDYPSHTTPEVTVYEHESLNIKTDKSEDEQINSHNDEYSTESQEKVTTLPLNKNVKITSHETHEQEQEDNVVETTPSYHRVRVRPGVIRQHYQPSSTDSSRIKNDRRNNIPITYRPAFDKRRTTMRIEEIEADLKTKQVHSRPEFKDYKQPVYKPEPTTESSTTEATTRRNQFRRKRPTFTTTSTEGTVNRKPFEIKNRFRGRRPTEKPTDKPDAQTVTTSTSTVRSILHNRYNRPKLSERFNKKPVVEETPSDDQDSNYSLHRPKYTSPNADHWSPKVSSESFKPYNPNNIDEETKAVNNDQKIIDEEQDIITAKNDNEVLISVTPATNNRIHKNIEEMSPTLEALVDNAKVTKNDTGEMASTFESMLEEVMKSLEEQDEDEYTSNVMKHKGGEIGEIPPEKVISSGVNYSVKATKPLQEQTKALTLTSDNSTSLNDNEDEQTRKSRRRGYWKKVKVHPATDGIDVAESQYYSDTVNTLGKTISKSTPGISTDKSKYTVTTYKPSYQFLKSFLEAEEENVDIIPHIDVPKLNNNNTENETEKLTDQLTTENSILLKSTPIDDMNPGDMDLGTGSPDPTYDDSSFYSEPTEPTSTSTKVDRSDRFSLMDYLFGVTSPDEAETDLKRTETTISTKTTERYQDNIETETQTVKTNATTESPYIPDEITTETSTENVDFVSKSVNVTVSEKAKNVESSSESSFMNPTNVISTSMSTEISHETEICFRGKCIKTNKDIL